MIFNLDVFLPIWPRFSYLRFSLGIPQRPTDGAGGDLVAVQVAVGYDDDDDDDDDEFDQFEDLPLYDSDASFGETFWAVTSLPFSS